MSAPPWLLRLLAVAVLVSADRSLSLDADPSSNNKLDQQIKKLTGECRKEIQGLVTDLMSLCRKTQASDCESQIYDLFLADLALAQKGRWLARAARSEKDAMLWAGFWSGPGAEANRTTKEALFNFADLMNTSTVHPMTQLGQIVEDNGVLQSCGRDQAAMEPLEARDNGLLSNFWTMASKAFVKSMAWKKQSSIVVLVNKDTSPNAERNLYDSVLWKYELPRIAFEVATSASAAPVSFGHRPPWRPQLALVDLRGRCDVLLEKMRHQATSSEEVGFAMMSAEKRMRVIQRWLKDRVTCLPCVSPCKLNEEFAEALREKLTETPSIMRRVFSWMR